MCRPLDRGRPGAMASGPACSPIVGPVPDCLAFGEGPRGASLTEAPRIGLYCRTAAASSTSIARQLHAMESWAPSLGGAVIATFIDNGISGFGRGGPGLRAAIDAAENGRINLLLMERADRISRDLMICMDVLSRLDRCGVRVETLDGGGLREPRI